MNEDNKKIPNDNQKKIAGVVAIIIMLFAIIMFGKLMWGEDPFSNSEASPTPSTYKILDDGTMVMSEDDPDYAEDFPEIPKSKYKNNKTLTAYSNDKIDTLTVGTICSDMDGIVLNPIYSKATADNKIGYYINDDSEDFDVLYYSYSDSKNDENLVIDWTYDNVCSAEYKNNKDYGAKWKILQLDNPKCQEVSIKIVVVDMASRNILSSFTAIISRDKDGNFELSELFNNDIESMPAERVRELWNSDIPEDNTVESLGETMAPYESIDFKEYRELLVNEAIDIINSGKYINAEKPLAVRSSVVELTSSTYHDYIMTEEGKVEHQELYPLWAVTINSVFPTNGHYTVYIGKERRIIPDLRPNGFYFHGYDYVRLESWKKLETIFENSHKILDKKKEI